MDLSAFGKGGDLRRGLFGRVGAAGSRELWQTFGSGHVWAARAAHDDPDDLYHSPRPLLVFACASGSYA